MHARLLYLDVALRFGYYIVVNRLRLHRIFARVTFSSGLLPFALDLDADKSVRCERTQINGMQRR